MYFGDDACINTNIGKILIYVCIFPFYFTHLIRSPEQIPVGRVFICTYPLP